MHSASYRNENWLDPNFKTLHPDIITEFFIGDAKYYRISEFNQNPFEKELYAYNVANNNSQPNFVFIPSEETKHLKTLTHDFYKLEIVTVDFKTILNDYFKKNQETLSYIKTLI